MVSFFVPRKMVCIVIRCKIENLLGISCCNKNIIVVFVIFPIIIFYERYFIYDRAFLLCSVEKNCILFLIKHSF